MEGKVGGCVCVLVGGEPLPLHVFCFAFGILYVL
jgi:hypothetical protein